MIDSDSDTGEATSSLNSTGDSLRNVSIFDLVLDAILSEKLSESSRDMPDL